MTLACRLNKFKLDQLNYARWYIPLLSRLQQFPKLFFFREKEEPLERLMASPLLLKVAFFSRYLQPSKPRVSLCFRGLSRTVPNAAAWILKLSRRVRQKTLRKSNKGAESQATRTIWTRERGSHWSKWFQNTPAKSVSDELFSPRTEKSTHMRAK